jgi:hypothetical protein
MSVDPVHVVSNLLEAPEVVDIPSPRLPLVCISVLSLPLAGALLHTGVRATELDEDAVDGDPPRRQEIRGHVQQATVIRVRIDLEERRMVSLDQDILQWHLRGGAERGRSADGAGPIAQTIVPKRSGVPPSHDRSAMVGEPSCVVLRGLIQRLGKRAGGLKALDLSPQRDRKRGK